MILKDKTALITGGTKGIGFGVAQAMVQCGMKVCITGRSQESVNSALANMDTIPPDRIMGLVADVVSREDMDKVCHKMNETWGEINVVIANAGVGHFATIEDMTDQQWHEVIDVNLTGVYNTIKSSLEGLKKSKGYFITIASLAGTNFFARGAAYNASKFGLVGFTQAVMLDLRQDDIKCTTIMPGSVATYFNNHVPNDADAWKIQPEDIGKMVIDLLTMHPRTLPSKIEVRPSKPPQK